MEGPCAEVFGRRIVCACGKTHAIEPRIVELSEDAVERTPAILASLGPGRRVAVVGDGRTAALVGTATADRLRDAGFLVREVVLPDRLVRGSVAPGRWLPAGSPVCDDHARDALTASLGECDALLAVGSGVINDCCKWVAHDRDIPYVALATAASMNGYTSANVAPTIGGVKVLLRARPPVAVLAAPALLAAAPYELTSAGLGDVIAKSVSSADWLLNHLLFGDYFCERSVGLIAAIEPLYVDHCEDLRAGGRALAALFEGLLLTGAAMTMAETSAPASGGEHMVSHTLDMMATVDARHHDLHGRQVGVGTVLAAEIYRRVLAIERPRPRVIDAGIDRTFWGPLADAVAAEHAAKRERLHTAAARISDPACWDGVRRRCGALVRAPERIREWLRRAGAAHRAEDILCDRDRLAAALGHGHEIRSRVTILDLARLVGVLPDAVEEIVAAWA